MFFKQPKIVAAVNGTDSPSAFKKRECAGLWRQLKSNGILLIPNAPHTASIIESHGYDAIPLLLKGLNYGRKTDNRLVPLACLELGITAIKNDAQLADKFIDAIRNESAPVAFLLYILENACQKDTDDFIRGKALSAAKNVLDRGIELRKEAAGLTSLVLTGSLTVENGLKSRVQAMRHLLFNIAAGIDEKNAFDSLKNEFKEGFAANGTLNKQHIKKFALQIEEMNSHGILLAKCAIHTISKVGDTSDMLGIIPLLGSNSKEIRNSVAYALVRHAESGMANSKGISEITRCLVSATLSGDTDMQTAFGILSNRIFLNSLKNYYTTHPEIINGGSPANNWQYYFNQFLFLTFSDIRTSLINILRLRNNLGEFELAIDTFLLMLPKFPKTSIGYSEYKVISEEIPLALSDKTLGQGQKKKLLSLIPLLPQSLLEPLRTKIEAFFADDAKKQSYSEELREAYYGCAASIQSETEPSPSQFGRNPYKPIRFSDILAHLPRELLQSAFKSAGLDGESAYQFEIPGGILITEVGETKSARNHNDYIYVLEPSCQTAEIRIEGRSKIEITHLGKIGSGASGEVFEGDHSARITYGYETDGKVVRTRSPSLSQSTGKSVSFSIDANGAACRYSISNRTNDGAIIVRVREFFTPSPFSH